MWEGSHSCTVRGGKATLWGSSHGLLRAQRWRAEVPNAPHPLGRTMCKGDARGPGLVSGGMLPLRRRVKGAERCCPSAHCSVRLSGKGLGKAPRG